MAQLGLFKTHKPTWEKFDLPDASVRMRRDFILPTEASRLFELLRESIPWRADSVRIYGKEHALPRLQQWYGDPGLTYKWSGISMAPEPWPSLLAPVRSRVCAAADTVFNTVLVNYYRDGQDTVSWHTDDEPELGDRPVIASLSLGAERDFVLRHRHHKDRQIPDAHVALAHGSLLIMAGDTQRRWTHSLPRRRGVQDGRINLTFRKVVQQSAP